MGWSLMEGPPPRPNQGLGALSNGEGWYISLALGGVLGALPVHGENLTGPLMSGQAITCPQLCSGRPGCPWPVYPRKTAHPLLHGPGRGLWLDRMSTSRGKGKLLSHI